ncbi:hypothetical protein [Streptomyces sp. NPDC055749]
MGRSGRRWAGRACGGYLLLAAASSVAPDVLTERVAGHLSSALLLLFPQLLLMGWALLGHHRDSRRLDGSLSEFRRSLDAGTRREAR